MNKSVVKGCIYFISILFIGISLSGCDQTVQPNSKPRGPQWMLYNTSNSPLVSDSVNAVIVYYDDTKWIATGNGANSLNGVIWRKITDSLYFDGPFGRNRKVNTITIGKDRSVWFGFAGGGIIRLNLYSSLSSKWKRYRTPVINSDYVYSLATDNLGYIYAGTSAGVSRFVPNDADPDEGQWFKYGPGNSPFSDEPVRNIGFNLVDNLMWFGTSSQGIVSFDGDFTWNTDTPSELPFPIVAMAFSRTNHIWFGTYADWAYNYSTATFEWTHITDSVNGGEGLKDKFVNAAAVQSDGTVWFGTNKGLTKMSGSSMFTFTRANSSLPSDTVTSLAADGKGNLWIGTPKGLAEYNEEGVVP